MSEHDIHSLLPADWQTDPEGALLVALRYATTVAQHLANRLPGMSDEDLLQYKHFNQIAYGLIRILGKAEAGWDSAWHIDRTIRAFLCYPDVVVPKKSP